MTTINPPALMQRLEALNAANQARIGMAALKKELARQQITFAMALADPRALPMEIGALLTAQRKWGPMKTRSLLKRLMISEHRRVRDLTSHQRYMLLEAVGR